MQSTLNILTAWIFQMSQISKTLAYILRHNPGKFDLVMDKQGWVEVQPLVDALVINIATLVGIVKEDNKGRYELSPDGQKIRATQGHSIDVDVNMGVLLYHKAKVYHGTATRFLNGIFEEGLKPGSRQHVHMITDPVKAREVGTRHGVPVVLEIDIQALIDENPSQRVYESANGYILTEVVPPKYIKILEDD